MPKLILARHLLSQWNEENRFNGWVDTPLAEGQSEKAEEMAKKIFRHKIDVIYCSRLFRNMASAARILEYDEKYPLFIQLDDKKMQKWGNFKDLSDKDIPVYVTDKLNERYYGELQGSNREEAIKKYGREQVLLWRRGFETKPPWGESLKDTYKRVVPFFRGRIEKDLKEGKNVLVVSSHNALRALVKYIEKISDKDIVNVEIPYGGFKEYDF